MIHSSGEGQATEDRVQRIWRLAGNFVAKTKTLRHVRFKVEQASTGVKGKVKTEALKKEREAQVLISPVFQNGISPGAIHMLIINNVKNCDWTFLNAGCCRIWRLVVWGWCWEQQQWLLYPSGRPSRPKPYVIHFRPNNMRNQSELVWMKIFQAVLTHKGRSSNSGHYVGWVR